MTDKTTKLLLLAIALGLWANALIPVVRPTVVGAQNSQLGSIDDHLDNIETAIVRIGRGTCTNGKLC